MKRLNSSDSSLDPICPSGWVDDEEDVLEVGGPTQAGEKKRRLRVDQVRALEKNFEVENKLEPDRKSQLAQELGLQPRQVAVWFQNRRARWKTKQLERDYGALKSRYDALRLDYDALLRDKDSLLAELKHLKSRLNGGDERFASIVKEEEEEEEEEENKTHEVVIDDEPAPLICNKEGSSDSDSSAVLDATRASFSFSSPFLYQHQLLKAEDEEFMNGDEPCSSFFQDELPPTLSWCCGEGWE